MSSVTDFHAHAFPEDLAGHAIKELEKLQGSDQPGACIDGTVDGLLRSMDSAGIDRSVICSIATTPKQTGAILKWSLDIANERIIPFASLHPDMSDPAAFANEVAEVGLRGIKLHPQYQGFDLADESTWALFEAIEQQTLICVLHCGLDFAFPMDDERAHPEKVRVIHDRFPDMPLVAAHMGGWKRWESVLEHLAGTDIYLETSYTSGYVAQDTLDKILQKHAIDRILFGSDSPWQDQAKTLEFVRDVFSPSDFRKVTTSNANALLSPFRTDVSC